MKHLNKQRESELLLLPPSWGDLFIVTLDLGSLLRVEGNLAQFKQLTLKERTVRCPKETRLFARSS